MEHHIEKHYEIDSDLNYQLQYLEVGEEFYENRLDSCLNFNLSDDFEEFMHEEYGTHEAIDDFEFLKERSFKSFFRDQGIDVPRCFEKTLSVRRPINQLDFLKFNNYFMRDGKRLKSLKTLNKVKFQLIDEIKNSELKPLRFGHTWKDIFTLLNTNVVRGQQYRHFITPQGSSTTYGHELTSVGKFINND